LDILGTLDRMKEKLKNGQYKSQYEFTIEVEQLVIIISRSGHPMNQVFTTNFRSRWKEREMAISAYSCP
jgi:hypothetical protein